MHQEQSDGKEKIEIKKVAINELESFTRGLGDEGTGQLIPISPARVQSQINNPCADDDIVLLTAFCGSQCVGYLGLLPGLSCVQGEVSKITWGTTFFVSPSMRGRGVGKLLVAAMQQLNIDFVGTCMTESAESLYRSMGMGSLGSLRYGQLRIDKLKSLVTQDWSDQYSEDREFFHGETGSNSDNPPTYAELKQQFYNRIFHDLDTVAENFSVREVKRIAGPFASQQCGVADIRFYKPVEVVNWMLSYPWVFSIGEIEKKDAYHFSSTRQLFTYKAFHVEGKFDKRPCGFVVVSLLTHKGRTLVKLLDYSFQESEAECMAMVVALRCGALFGADRFEYDIHLNQHLPRWLMESRYAKQQNRLYIFQPKDNTSVLQRHRGKFELAYGDGDVGFT